MSSIGGSRAGDADLGSSQGPSAGLPRSRPPLAGLLFGEPGSRAWWERLPLASIAVLGVFAAAIDGAFAAANPHAHPEDAAASFRVAAVVALVVAGIFARTARLHARMGVTLLAAVPLVALWLLDGSELALPFTVGLLLASFVPAVFSYLLLAHPTGRLHSRAERQLLAWSGGTMAALWTLLVLTHAGPPFAGPLVRCAPHCPRNLASVGGLAPIDGFASAGAKVAWFVLCGGTLLLLLGRLARATPPVRRVIGPTVVVAAASAVCLTGFFVTHLAGSGAAQQFEAAYLATAVATPAAILLGLLLERLYMGRALADLLERLGGPDAADVERVMAETLHDPTLTVAYSAGAPGRFVDALGAPVALPPPGRERAAVVIERDGTAAAAVVFDSQLVEQERYVQAAGEAALMWMQKSRLESDRAISRFELAVSRRRVQEAAVEERRRIQRDLHDGAQQRLLAVRARIARLIDGEGDALGRRESLSEIQRELGETLQDVRTLAEGVYPPLLVEYGLTRALRGVCRGLPGAVVISDEGIGRFSTPVEGAVYFTCLEALQNVAKHAGEEATARVQLWCEEGELHFEVADDGRGFALADLERSDGLVNMRDRITALGGRLQVYSAPGTGTVITGSVPALAERGDSAAGVPGGALRDA